jgi:Xaa-Pro dipeptidase
MEVFQKKGLDMILVFGVDNFNYITNSILPFAEYYPDRKAVTLIPMEGKSILFLPFDWSQAIKDQGWNGETQVYNEDESIKTEALVKRVSKEIKNRGLESGKIGIDTKRVTFNLLNQLKVALPKTEWQPIDDTISEMRIIKTPDEVALIEKASKQADEGIIWALMHLEGTVDTLKYTIAEFTERIRVHVNENGASGVGLLATSLGSDGQIYYTPQRGWFRNGEIFRMDVSCHFNGYWTSIGRMGVTGKPTPEQTAAYQENRRLKMVTLDMLKPGVLCNEVYAHTLRESERMAIGFWKEAGIGHGVGASHHEAPFLNLSDSTELKPGMVVALDIYTYGPRQELIHDKDIYVITEESNRKLSWYRDWDRLYSVTGFRATH